MSAAPLPEDWPIRCQFRWSSAVGRPACGAPAVVGVQFEFTCGCSRLDNVACQGCVDTHPVGLTQHGRCLNCGQNGITCKVVAHRPLNEGDLP